MNKPIYHNQSLPKKEIIKKRDTFKEIIQKGKHHQFKYLQFFIMESKARQIGFTVPRRFGKAVRRNHIKRLMREIYRKHRQEIGHFQIVVLANKEADSAGLPELESEFQQFISFCGIH
ncbi:ribonuclease P protein component [bacterium]|nr:ribonuclease P protein component [bacterium]RQV93308.1 MAG: ribonuclease P protein component [bacterium]